MDLMVKDVFTVLASMVFSTMETSLVTALELCTTVQIASCEVAALPVLVLDNAH